MGRGKYSFCTWLLGQLKGDQNISSLQQCLLKITINQPVPGPFQTKEVDKKDTYGDETSLYSNLYIIPYQHRTILLLTFKNVNETIQSETIMVCQNMSAILIFDIRTLTSFVWI